MATPSVDIKGKSALRLGHDSLKRDTLAPVVFRSNVQEVFSTSDSRLPSDQPNPSAFNPIFVEQEIPTGLRHALHVPSLGEQQRRVSLFEPYSLPPSRVPSHESHFHGLHPPPRINSTTGSPMHSPPLTPAATHERLQFRTTRSLEVRDSLASSKVNSGDPAAMTPQQSPPRKEDSLSPPTSSGRSSRPGSAGRAVPISVQPHRGRPSFQIGPTESIPSREGSPIDTSSNASPPGSGATTPWYPPSRPFTPAGEFDDPYARSKRPPPNKNLQDIEARFIFGRSGTGSTSTSSADLKNEKHRHSHLSLTSLVAKHGKDSSTSLATAGSKHSSMAELKRFFKSSNRRAISPSQSLRSTRSTTFPSITAPFGDDHGLSKRYGKFGKVLGSGAGGSVRLMKRSSDGTTFAVKEFRARHNYESEREYAKKVTAEFCIGSTLHHGNIVETLDIVQEKGKWYEVMEYCPYDLFATVMTAKMTREEVACCFMQILNGVTYLHGMGLAHRDLKLDNVVINEHGILKIIDFGSASVFRYPFENDIVEACGIVGSDPYLAPEVCNDIKYDPQPADVWSLAIIFCCMSLRRFPWKAPRQNDKSFKLFCARPEEPSQSTNGQALPTSRAHQQRPQVASRGSPPAPATRVGSSVPEDSSANNPHPSTVGREGEIRGPIRLLRLLPRESRSIIGRMLEIDPKKRATIDDIWRDPWISGCQMCKQDEDGKIHKALNHTHTLEGQGSGSAQSSRKSTK